MIIEIVLQAFFFLFAAASGFEEEGFTYPFREIYFDTQTKFRKLKKAHRAGAIGVFFLLVMAGVIEWMTYSGNPGMKLLAGALAFAVCGFWYWFTFDPVYGLQIGQGAFYLGSTAGTDGSLNKLLGKNAGLKKALFCVVVIITINLIYGLLLY